MVNIRVNLLYSQFAGLDPKHIRVTVGTLDDPSLFFNFTKWPGTGDSGNSARLFEVSPSRPLSFENKDFALLGSYSNDAFQASRALASLVDLVRRGVLLADKDGAALSGDDLTNFTP